MTIDTLRMAQRLQAAEMPRAQAEALSKELAESLQDVYVTREYLDARLHRVTLELIVATVAVVGLFDGALFWAITTLLPHATK